MSRPHLQRTFRLRRDIPSRLSDVDALCREIRSSLDEHGFEAVGFTVELTVRECLNNAVLHGNTSDPAKRVSLDLHCTTERVRVRIADEGPGFDWRKRRPGTVPDPEATVGRGLAIVAGYADRLAFNQKGNQITLWLQQQQNRRGAKAN